MKPKLIQLFRDALDLPSAEVAAFLDAHCPDALLRAEIDALLAASQAATAQLPSMGLNWLAQAKFTPETRAPLDRTGQIVGPFRLTRLLGSGGMGAVWQGRLAIRITAIFNLRLFAAGWTRNPLGQQMCWVGRI